MKTNKKLTKVSDKNSKKYRYSISTKYSKRLFSNQSFQSNFLFQSNLMVIYYDLDVVSVIFSFSLSNYVSYLYEI